MASPKQSRKRAALGESLLHPVKRAAGVLTTERYECPQCGCDRVYELANHKPADCRKQEIWGSGSEDSNWTHALTCDDCLTAWAV